MKSFLISAWDVSSFKSYLNLSSFQDRNTLDSLIGKKIFFTLTLVKNKSSSDPITNFYINLNNLNTGWYFEKFSTRGRVGVGVFSHICLKTKDKNK
jgi:hypothetical protein